MIRFAPLALILTCSLSTANVIAEQEGEILFIKYPEGYSMIRQERVGDTGIAEFVPDNEIDEEWQNKLTSEIHYGGIAASPKQYAQMLVQIVPFECVNGGAEIVSTGKENKYNFALWIEACPKNQQTGFADYKLIKVIEGKDSSYVVKKVWRFEPSLEEIRDWSSYLSNVFVCDTRSKRRPCPEGT